MRWFPAILRVGRLNSVLLSHFVDAKAPDYIIHMDASDRGLCALWTVRKKYLQLEFDQEERRLIETCNASVSDEFSINIRELMSAVFASIVWASKWSQSEQHDHGHTKFWIDNTYAVPWANRRSSRTPFAQFLLRLIGFLEVHNNFYSSAGHIRGVDNVMADAERGCGNPMRWHERLLTGRLRRGRSQSRRAPENSRRFGSIAPSRSSSGHFLHVVPSFLGSVGAVVRFHGLSAMAHTQLCGC